MAKGSSKKNGSQSDRAVAGAATPTTTVTTAHADEVEATVTAPSARPDPLEIRAERATGSAVVEPGRSAPSGSTGIVERGGEIAVASLQAVRSVLPTSRVPVVLLGAGLLVAGAIELPALLGAGLAYEALQRWQPATP